MQLVIQAGFEHCCWVKINTCFYVVTVHPQPASAKHAHLLLYGIYLGVRQLKPHQGCPAGSKHLGWEEAI